MRKNLIIVGLLLLKSGNALGGVLSAYEAVRCSANGEPSQDCDAIKTSLFEGRFGLLLGLDGAFMSRSPQNVTLQYEGPGSGYGEYSKTTKIDIKLKSHSGFRFGPTLRLHLLDWIGVAFDAGYQWASLGTEEDENQMVSTTEFNLSYGGGYLGTTFYFPVQKADSVGLFFASRRLLSNTADASLRLSSSSNEKGYEATASKQITDFSLGVFISVFYISYTVRDEQWQVVNTETERFSAIKSNASGFELGVSGPIWHLWP